jgi:hypothetical protein
MQEAAPGVIQRGLAMSTAGLLAVGALVAQPILAPSPALAEGAVANWEALAGEVANDLYAMAPGLAMDEAPFLSRTGARAVPAVWGEVTFTAL